MCMQANIDHTVDPEEFRFLLTGGIGAGEVPPNPLPWLGAKLWAEMNRLSSLLGFVGFAEELEKDPVRPLQTTQHGSTLSQQQYAVSACMQERKKDAAPLSKFICSLRLERAQACLVSACHALHTILTPSHVAHRQEQSRLDSLPGAKAVP